MTANRSRSTFALLVIAAATLTACTEVDTTERCIETRYGKVVNEQMATGLNLTMTTHATCFTMTERNFPSDPSEKELIEAQTRDPITVSGDVAIIYQYDPATIYEVFREKRTAASAEAEILNAIREGYRNALARWTIAEVFEHRATLADSVKAQIQRKLGRRAIIRQVFVRDIKVPQVIEQARIAAAKQDQVLDQARKEYLVDSVRARGVVVSAEGNARAKQLEAQSYAANPKLLDLEMAKAQASGLARACNGVTTCVIGGSVADTWGKR